MSFTEDDYRESLEGRLKDERDRRLPDLKRAVQAAVAMEQLVGDPLWDGFLRMIEGLAEVARARIAEADTILQSPTEVDQAALMRAKIARAAAAAEAAAFEAVTQIPRRLMDEGDIARKAIAL